MPAERVTIPRCIATGAAPTADASGPRQRRRRRSPTPSSTTRSRALARRARPRRGWARATASGCLMPNGIEWATVALAVMRVGARARAAQHAAPAARAAARSCAAAVVSTSIAVRTYRGRDVPRRPRRVAPGVDASARPRDRPSAARRCADVWTSGELAGRAPRRGAHRRRARGASFGPPTTSRSSFTSGSRGAPKGVIHTHGSALRATRVGLEARCIGAGERLYIPMPFFWTGGFGGGLLSVLVAGATLLTEVDARAERTRSRFLERERRDAVPRLARPGRAASRRTRRSPTADLSSLRPGSLGAVLPPAQQSARPGARANLFGMTESFGPYCGDAPRHRPARGEAGQLRPAVRRHRGAHRRIRESGRGAARRASRARSELRGPNLMRGICGRPARRLFTADGYYRTGDLGRLDADGYLWYARPPRRHVQGEGRHRLPVGGRVRAALPCRVSRKAFVTDVDRRRRAGRSAALVVTGRRLATTMRAACGAQRLSAFKVPGTVAGQRGDVTSCRCSPTGKVDKPSPASAAANDGTHDERRSTAW